MATTKTVSKNDDVNVPSSQYNDMSVAGRWDLLDSLLGGTEAMINAQTKWLPKEKGEDETAYESRLARSYLFNGYEDSLDRLSAKPFSKPVTIQGELPDALKELVDDVDQEGTDLSDFARQLLYDAIDRGLIHVFVDFPSVPENATRRDEQNLKVRPTFVKVPAKKLIGWRVVRAGNGRPILSQIRIRELHEQTAGKYGSETVPQVRVVTPTDWEVFQADENKKFAMAPTLNGTMTFTDPDDNPMIPLFTAYTKKKGFMVAKPPLLSLAETNLTHWQSASDQRNILKFARTSLLFLKGMPKSDVKDGVVLGANQFFHSEAEEADGKYLEQEGKAIGAGQEDLNQLENKMQQQGMRPIVQRTGAITATERAIDESNVQTDIQAWIRVIESLLEQCFWAAARWTGTELPVDFKINIFNEFGLGLLSGKDLDLIMKLRENKDITQERVLKEFVRRSVLGDDLDITQEVEDTEAEAPDLAAMIPPVEDDDGDEFE